MKVLNWDDSSAVHEALKILLDDGVVMLQHQTAFALLAAPTQAACENMRAIKRRPIEGYNFGFAVGDLSAFHEAIDVDSLPPSIRDDTSKLETIAKMAHANVVFSQDESLDNIIVRRGTVNGYITPSGGPLREFFTSLEAGLAGHNEPGLLGGKDYSAPLITSCNENGKGTIVEWKLAEEFGKAKGIPLMIRAIEGGGATNGKGSYPVVELRKDSFRILRRGVGIDDLVSRDAVSELRTSFVKHILETAGLLGDELSLTGLLGLFKSIDVDNSGYLDEEEMGKLFSRLAECSGGSLSPKDSTAVFAAIDFNSDGQISFAEFLRFLNEAHDGAKISQMIALERKFVEAFESRMLKTTGNADISDAGAFISAFEDIDLDKDGTVDKTEFRMFLQGDDCYGEEKKDQDDKALTELELEVLFSLIDVDESGSVDLWEIYEHFFASR